MLVRYHQQRSFSQLVLFGALNVAPEQLMDPQLRRIDQLLQDERYLQPVIEALGNRHPNSRRLGRNGTPAETVLRMLVLRVLRNWTWERLVWEVRGNVVYRRFCHIDGGDVPNDKTLIELNEVVGPEALRQILTASVGQAIEQKVTRGRKMRIDTTVVEAPIRYPLDSRLLEDGIRVLGRGMRRLAKLGVELGGRVRNVSRSVSRAVRSLAAALERKGRDVRREAIKKPYRKLLAIAARARRQAADAAARARAQVQALSERARRAAARTADQLDVFAERVHQVIRQTRARLFQSNPRSEGKIVSIHEPWVEVLRRGKASRPTEYGKLVKVQESEGGIVTDIGIASPSADAPLLVPAVERHREVFGRVPDLAATDRGFYSKAGEDELKRQGVPRPVVPKPGHRSAARKAYEQQRWFRRGRAWRTGGEGRISYLERSFGMDRSRARGERGLERTAIWAGIANNLAVMARVAAARS